MEKYKNNFLLLVQAGVHFGFLHTQSSVFILPAKMKKKRHKQTLKLLRLSIRSKLMFHISNDLIQLMNKQRELQGKDLEMKLIRILAYQPLQRTLPNPAYCNPWHQQNQRNRKGPKQRPQTISMKKK